MTTVERNDNTSINNVHKVGRNVGNTICTQQTRNTKIEHSSMMSELQLIQHLSLLSIEAYSAFKLIQQYLTSDRVFLVIV